MINFRHVQLKQYLLGQAYCKIRFLGPKSPNSRSWSTHTQARHYQKRPVAVRGPG